MSGPMKKHLFSMLVFLIVILAMTFPLCLGLDRYIPGFFSTHEPYHALWDSWRIKHSFLNNISLKKFPDTVYPFGFDVFQSGYRSYLWDFLHSGLSILSSPSLTYNLQALANMLLSAFFTYLLVFVLTGDVLPAIFSGIIFAFCPYQFMRSWQHLGLTYNEWLPLILLTAILLRENVSRINSILFLLSLLLLFSFDYTVIYLGTVALSTFLLYVFFYDRKGKRSRERNPSGGDRPYFQRLMLLGLIAFIVLLPQLYPVVKNRLLLSSAAPASHFNPYRRPFEDLFIYSAKPLSYFLPAATNAFFGEFTGKFVGSRLYGVSFNEHTLYLGWVPLLMAATVFKWWRRNRQGRPAPDERPMTERDRFHVGYFLLLVAVAWWFSQPPWWKIGPIKILMPSFFMYKIMPMYRSYGRFGILVMLGVAVLAGFGLKRILAKWRSGKGRLLTAGLFFCLVLFEFWNWPPFKVIDVSRAPAVYYWLKEQPGKAALAEYPLDVNGPSEIYEYYQVFHQRPVINGTVPGIYPNAVARTMTKLSEPRTASLLSWMGVKYAVVHRGDYLDTERLDWVEELRKIPGNPGLKLVYSFPPQKRSAGIMSAEENKGIDLYEVVAEPVLPGDEIYRTLRLEREEGKK